MANPVIWILSLAAAVLVSLNLLFSSTSLNAIEYFVPFVGVLLQHLTFRSFAFPNPTYRSALTDDRPRPIIFGVSFFNRMKLKKWIERMTGEMWIRFLSGLFLSLGFLFVFRTEISIFGILIFLGFWAAFHPNILLLPIFLSVLRFVYDHRIETSSKLILHFGGLGLFLLLFLWLRSEVFRYSLFQDEKRNPPPRLGQVFWLKNFAVFLTALSVAAWIVPDKPKNKPIEKIPTQDFDPAKPVNDSYAQRSLEKILGVDGPSGEFSGGELGDGANSGNRTQGSSSRAPGRRKPGTKVEVPPPPDAMDPNDFSNRGSPAERANSSGAGSFQSSGRGDFKVSDGKGGRPYNPKSLQNQDGQVVNGESGQIPDTQPGDGGNADQTPSSAPGTENSAWKENSQNQKAASSTDKAGAGNGSTANPGSTKSNTSSSTSGSRQAGDSAPQNIPEPKATDAHSKTVKKPEKEIELPKPPIKFPTNAIWWILGFAALGAVIIFVRRMLKKDLAKVKVSEANPHQRNQAIDDLLRECESDLINLEGLDEVAIQERIIRLYKKFLDYCALCSLEKPIFYTPDEFAAALAKIFPTRQTEIDRLTNIFCLTFYGNYSPKPKSYKVFAEDLLSLGKHIKPLGANHGWREKYNLSHLSGPSV